MPTKYGQPNPSSPSLSDLTSGSIQDILSNMGFSQSDIDKYAEYFQDYDPYKEEYAQERYGIEAEGFGLEKAGISLQEGLTRDLYGLGQMSFDRKMGQTLSAGEGQMYDIYSQQRQLSGSGLGDTSRFTKRAKKTAMSGAYGGLQDLSDQMWESDIRFSSAMSGYGLQRSEIGIKESLADLELRQVQEESRRDYEDEFWDFLTMLGTEFDVFAT